MSDAIFIPSLPTTGRRTLHNPRVSILSRAGLILAATVFAAACAPAGAPPAAGPSASASAAAEACPSGGLPTLTAGTLTIGTDQPAYQPWFVDDAPENGQGFESAVAYAIAEQLGYPKDKVTWARVPFNAAIQPGPKPFDLDLNQFSITDERRQAVDFSAPYYDVKQAVVALSDNLFANATNLAGLAEAPAGRPGRHHQLRRDQRGDQADHPGGGVQHQRRRQAGAANGQVDAIVVDLPTAFFITAAELQNAKIVGQLPAGTGTPEQFGAVLDKNSPLTPCVSEAVEALRSAGTLTALEQQWLTAAGSAPELT